MRVEFVTNTSGDIVGTGITTPRNILLQGLKDFSIANFATVTAGSQNSNRLQLRISPRSLLEGIRIQAGIEVAQRYDSWDTQKTSPRRSQLTLQAALNTSTSVFGTAGRIFLGSISNLRFDGVNQIDALLKVPDLQLVDEFYIGFYCTYIDGGSTIAVSHNTTHQFKIFSLTFEDRPIGCESVQVQSLDGRLVSTTGNKLITYPILFLGRPPVREDAQGLKEVLVFQDRATTLRVMPQPVVLNEENEYSQNASVESNGHWMLYEYDTVKLRGTLGSGLPITGGAGNDIVHVRKSSTFVTYGLYNLTLLFATDTSDEPYIVPVILDYAVPLSVNGQTRILNISLDEENRSIVLNIIRDRYWRIVGFPSEHFTIGVLEGVRNTTTVLRLLDDYKLLGVNHFTFIVQSGIKRVIVNVEVRVDKYFQVSKNYVLLTPANNYQQIIYIKRYNYGTSSEYGYTHNTPSNHTISRRILGTTPPSGVADGNEPPGTIYDEITITYTGDVTNTQVSTASNSFTFATVTDNSQISITCFRNIELNFEVTGTNNRPTGDNANWSFTKTMTANSVSTNGTAWKYITPTVDPNNTAAIHVRANQSVSTSGTGVSTSTGLAYNDLRNGRDVIFSSGSLFLNREYEVVLTFQSYSRYIHNQNQTGVTTQSVAATAVTIRFEVRHPHFLRVNDSYLQYDNNWLQHHWLLTNPDAVISIQGHNGGTAFTCTPPASYTAGDFLAKMERRPDSARLLEVHTVNIRSAVPNSIAAGTWLSSPNRNIDGSFNVSVYHPVLIRNEIVPQMAANDRENNMADEEVASLTTASDYPMFSRNNRESVPVTFNASTNKLYNKATYDDRQNTAAFTVNFDRPRMIRSWSYTAHGDRNIACGFLIEGWLDGINRWETISAVTDYNTLSSSYAQNDIVMDYATVSPRPWSKVRISITQVRNASGSTTTGTVNGNFNVGQFQFYEGFPVLQRINSIQRGNQTGQQLNTRYGNVRYIARNDSNSSYIVVSVSDGKLLPKVELSGSGTYAMLDGIDEVGYYNATHYWNYRLVNDAVNNLMPFSSGIACLGVTLDAAIQIIGIRYDTGIVETHSTAGAIAVETSGNNLTTSSQLLTVNNYSPLALVSAWRYLGQGVLPGLNSLEFNADAIAQLNQFAILAQQVIYGAEHPYQVIDGTMILRVDTDNHDYRLIRYANGTWKNIGQDIIYDTAGNPLGDTAAINAVAHDWMRVFNANHQNTDPLRDKIALTHPTSKRRWVYELNTETWEDTGEYSFDDYRGRQFYRNVNRTNVRSLRISIPGLADTADIRNGAERIRAIAGEIQLFEQFPGVNITYKDIRVNNVSVKYGEAVVVSNDYSVNVACDSLTINGESAPNNRLFALTRSGYSLSWSSVSQTGTNSSVSLESNNRTVTSITLYYQKESTNESRMYPFFTFTIVRQ
jgi:hypothetical protein